MSRVYVTETALHNDQQQLMETMKMETTLSTPCDGIISELHVTTGSGVRRGQVLLNIDCKKG